jgi:hypothetical protein
MNTEKNCQCPEIEDELWHLQDLNWSGKFFYFEYLYHFLKIPLGMEKRREEMFADIDRKGYQAVNPERVIHLPGMFQGRIMVEIEDPEQYDANVEKFDNARILTRVHRGSRSGLRRSLIELQAFSQDRAHIPPGAVYYWYASCPRCAKLPRLQKVVLLARI